MKYRGHHICTVQVWTEFGYTYRYIIDGEPCKENYHNRPSAFDAAKREIDDREGAGALRSGPASSEGDGVAVDPLSLP